MDRESSGESEERKSSYDDDGFEVLQSFSKPTPSVSSATPKLRSNRKWDADAEEKTDENALLNSTTTALNELTAPFSLNDASTELKTDEETVISTSTLSSSSDDTALMDENKVKSMELLGATLTQQEKLKENIANFVRTMSSTATFRDRKDSKPSEQPHYQEPQQRSLLIKATVAGFVTAFVLFLVYTMVFESFKYDQLLLFQNQTIMERVRSDRFLDQKDSLQDALMHKAYEEARKSSEELKLCQNKMTMQSNEIGGLKEVILQLNLEAKNREKDDHQKISNSEGQVQSKNEKINELRNNAKKLQDQVLQMSKEHKLKTEQLEGQSLQMSEEYQHRIVQLEGQLQSMRIQLRNNEKKHKEGIMGLLFRRGEEGIWVFSCGLIMGVTLMSTLIALKIHEWGPVRALLK